MGSIGKIFIFHPRQAHLMPIYSFPNSIPIGLLNVYVHEEIKRKAATCLRFHSHFLFPSFFLPATVTFHWIYRFDDVQSKPLGNESKSRHTNKLGNASPLHYLVVLMALLLLMLPHSAFVFFSLTSILLCSCNCLWEAYIEYVRTLAIQFLCFAIGLHRKNLHSNLNVHSLVPQKNASDCDSFRRTYHLRASWTCFQCILYQLRSLFFRHLINIYLFIIYLDWRFMLKT